MNEKFGMSYKKIAIFMGIAFLVYVLLFHAAPAHQVFSDALGGIGDAAAQLAQGVRTLLVGD